MVNGEWWMVNSEKVSGEQSMVNRGDRMANDEHPTGVETVQ